MMFDRQAQDPSDVTVMSSQAPMIHTQEGDKDSSKEEDDEEEHDMDVDSTATKKSIDQATFRSLGTGKQSSAGSADAEAAMGQMTLDNVPTEIQHGQQQNGDDMDDASVLSEAPADFEDNNTDSAEKPSEIRTGSRMVQQTTQCHFRAVPPPLNPRIVTVRTLLRMKKIHGAGSQDRATTG
jgi:hypothetical protein